MSGSTYLTTSAQILSLCSAATTILMLAPAVMDLNLIPSVIEPTTSYIFSALIALQTDLLFKRPELVKNAEELSSSCSNDPFRKAEEEREGGNSECLKKTKVSVGRAGNYLLTPLIAISLITVPLAVFALVKFQVKQMLIDNNLTRLLFNTVFNENDLSVLSISLVSAFLATFYSLGTEGASAFKEFARKKPGFGNFIKKHGALCCCCSCCLSVATPLAFIGAFEHSARESGSLISALIENKGLTDRASAWVIGILSLLIMTWQNTTFMGREFKHNFRGLFNYIHPSSTALTEMENPAAYNAIDINADSSINSEIELVMSERYSKRQKICLYLVNFLIVVTPSVLAHFSLSYFTLRQRSDGLRIFLATINTLVETFTETASACKEFAEILEPSFQYCCR